MRKIVPAVLMLLISAMLVGTSTYAWFAMNNKVTVTGMTVKTQVGDNLQIATSSLDATTRAADSAFVNSITQEVKGILEPASSIDAKKFYYNSTNNARGDGSAISASYLPYQQYNSEEDYGTKAANTPANYVDRFSENYDIKKDNATNKTFLGLADNTVKAVPYVDYVFQIKANNVDSSPKALKLTKLNLLYNGDDDTNLGKAYRIAFLTEEFSSAFTDGSALSNAVAGTAQIYTVASAANFTSGKAVNAVDGLGDVSYINAGTAIANVGAGTHYYKIVARLWLEGEDDTCTVSTYMDLNANWELQLAFELATTTEMVTNINQKLGRDASTFTVTETGAKTVSATNYNVVTDLTYKGAQVYTTAAAGTLPEDAQLFTIAGEPEAATEVTSSFYLY